jgi:hypothetical protein
MNPVKLQDLAQMGAQTRLATIDAEREALLKRFPDLRLPQQPSTRKNGSAPPTDRRRSGMSPAARKAHGERMRAYWANRRAENGSTAASQRETAADASPTPANPTRKRKGMARAARKAQESGCERTGPPSGLRRSARQPRHPRRRRFGRA